MIPLGFGFNENQRHQNCISQDASVTGFKRKVRNPGPEDHIRLHFFEPGLRTFLTYCPSHPYTGLLLLLKYAQSSFSFAADLGRKDCDRDAQILLPVQFENEIGHPDLIPEIEDSQERIVLQSETCNALPEVLIFMVELQYPAFTCFLCG